MPPKDSYSKLQTQLSMLSMTPISSFNIAYFHGIVQSYPVV